MSEEEKEQATEMQSPTDGGGVAQAVEQPQRQVPLEALEAEQRRRREEAKRREELEVENRVLKEYASRFQQEPEAKTAEDDLDLVNKRQLREFRETLTKQEMAALKREISEETFKEMNPEAIRQINTHLKEIIERKPWLASSIEEAPNRYARAYEIVQDYAPVLAAKKNSAKEAERIVENAKKPGSPVTVGKAAQGSQSDYLRSIAGTQEFREYRKKLLQGK